MYPFERFTERAKKVLTLAQEEAERSHHSYIGTEHLLLGLMRENEGLAAKIILNLGLTFEQAKNAVRGILGRNEKILITQIIPTSRLKKIIEIAFEEARQMNNEYVGTEHLLFGLLIEGEGIGAAILEENGITLEKVRTEYDRLIDAAALVEPAPFVSDFESVAPQIQPKRYRKKPVIIEALQFSTYTAGIISSWIEIYTGQKLVIDFTPFGAAAKIKTLEGEMDVREGDYVIRGIKGEFYSCREDIFLASYEEVME